MKKCELCNDEKMGTVVAGKYICNDCYMKACFIETSSIAYEEWKNSVVFREGYNDTIDCRISEIINSISIIHSDLKEQENQLLVELENEIKARLQYYQKHELIVAFLTIREIVSRMLLVQKEKTDWIIISDVSSINLLMKMTNVLEEFENHQIGEWENGCSNLANAICYAARYNTIVENIALTFGKDISLNEICFEAVETEETKKYFDIYLRNGVDEKPEDYKIHNPILNKKLQAETKTPDLILEGLNELLKKEFGFNRAEYQLLSTCLLRMEFPTEEEYWDFINGKRALFEQCAIYVMEKTLLEDLCGKKCIQAILDTFSINRNINNHMDSNELELFCFYEVNEMLVFGNFSFAQTISAFEKFLLSGDYIDIYKTNISKNSMIVKAQRNLSKFFSACVSEYLYDNGYKLPMEKYLKVKIPRAEIEKIEVNGKNILKDERDLGDIDVLALNIDRKEILLFELKFFKPAISSKEMLYKDRSKIVDKEVLSHIKEREKAVKQNIDEVVKFVLGEYQYGYTVKSILLTARTNYYAIQEKEVDYLTWSEFIERVEKRDI